MYCTDNGSCTACVQQTERRKKKEFKIKEKKGKKKSELLSESEVRA